MYESTNASGSFYAQVDATLKPGMDVTVCRFWVCDGASHAACESFQWTATPSTRRFARRYHAMICNGRSKPAKRPLSGNNGLVELDLADRGDRDLFACFEDWVVTYGMPHHVIICQGHHKASLAKFAAARGVKVV